MSTSTKNWLQRHRITVHEYYRMAEVGLLAPDARVELIEGEIIDMAPIGNRHQAAVDRLAQLLQALGPRVIVRTQGSIRLDQRSQPEPDIAILQHRDDFYSSRHATAADTLLIVEVSESSFRYDSEIKAPLYAKHGIPEMWIVDLNDDQLHRLRSPDGGHYTDAVVIRDPGIIGLSLLPDSVVDLSGFFTTIRPGN